MKSHIKVGVIDAMGDMRGILEAAFGRAEGFIWSGAFSSINQALLSFEREKPDVIMLEGVSGIEGLPLLKRLDPGIKVVVFTGVNEEIALRKAFAAGADGYLIKPLSETEAVAAVRAVCNEGTPVSPCAIRHLLRMLNCTCLPAPHVVELLTRRELEVMKHVARGHVDKEIACRLNLSVQTIKRHLHNIYSKLGVGNRVEAINRVNFFFAQISR